MLAGDFLYPKKVSMILVDEKICSRSCVFATEILGIPWYSTAKMKACQQCEPGQSGTF